MAKWKFETGVRCRTFTDQQAQAILDSDEHPSVLAKRYGVALNTIRNITSGRRYRHLKRNESRPSSSLCEASESIGQSSP
jgi:hypothetical protein